MFKKKTTGNLVLGTVHFFERGRSFKRNLKATLYFLNITKKDNNIKMKPGS